MLALIQWAGSFELRVYIIIIKVGMRAGAGILAM